MARLGTAALLLAASIHLGATPSFADETVTPTEAGEQSGGGSDLWASVPPQSPAIDEASAQTIATLVAGDLQRYFNVATTVTPHSCADVRCARESAREVGATHGALLQMQPLGSKMISTLSIIDVESGTIVHSEKMTAGRIEDLDAVITRMVKAMATGTTPADTAELGTVTQSDRRPKLRRKLLHGVSLGLGGMIPVGPSYGDSGAGMTVTLGYWLETDHWAISPRIGGRFDVSEGAGNYIEVPIDISGYYIFGLDDVTPYVGLGIGPRFVWERRETGVGTNTTTDSGVGFGTFGRLGMMFLRTYDVHLSVNMDYIVSVISLNSENPHHGFLFSAEFYL